MRTALAVTFQPTHSLINCTLCRYVYPFMERRAPDYGLFGNWRQIGCNAYTYFVIF